MHPNLFAVESLAEQRALLAEVERARRVALLPPQPREPWLRAPIRHLTAALGGLRLGARPSAGPRPTAHSTTLETSS